MQELRNVVHYTGHRLLAARDMAPIETSFRELAKSHAGARAFGSLSAGADLLFAEALQDAGARLTVVLPYPERVFIPTHVAPWGKRWLGIYRRCLRRAVEVRFITEDVDERRSSLQQAAAELAMGLALLEAKESGGQAIQLSTKLPRSGSGNTDRNVRLWRRSGSPLCRLDISGFADLRWASTAHGDAAPALVEGVPLAIVFTDFHGFSNLNAAQTRHFRQKVAPAIANAIAPYRRRLATINTWGDGTVIACPRATVACEIARRLLHATGRVGPSGAAELRMSLRIGAHFGIAQLFRNPITGHRDMIGPTVNSAARIEGLAEPGSMFASEAFVARLLLEGFDGSFERIRRIRLPKTGRDIDLFRLSHECGTSRPGLRVGRRR